ncbi:MAG: 1-phosphofructokinase [Clostridia bacterium]|nr:1-phosphofructokinase [Clostridia bacterium]
MVYTVTCNPALDYVMNLPQLTVDDINRSEREYLTFGGKGINVSAVLARLSVPTRALGFTAGFMGEKLKSLLTDEGVECDFVQLSAGETRINVKIRAETELHINAGGPSVGEADVERLLQKLEGVCAGDVLVLAGSVPSGLPQDLYVQMLRRLGGQDMLVAVDAEKDLLRETLPYRPFLIKPNHHELGALFGKELYTTEEIAACARQLQVEGARNVLVSRAKDGALLLDETGVCHTIGTAPGALRSSVGCGDSMVAGFIAGWLQQKNYAFALRLGAACGNATAFSDALAAKAEIEAVLSHLINK